MKISQTVSWAQIYIYIYMLWNDFRSMCHVSTQSQIRQKWTFVITSLHATSCQYCEGSMVLCLSHHQCYIVSFHSSCIEFSWHLQCLRSWFHSTRCVNDITFRASCLAKNVFWARVGGGELVLKFRSVIVPTLAWYDWRASTNLLDSCVIGLLNTHSIL